MTDNTFTAKEFGGKAAELFRLASFGFKIPKTYVSPDNLEEAVNEIGFPIAVRSSATLEDGAHTSFAGQFESYLNLNSLAAVKTAIEKCQQSVKQASVIDYCKKHHINYDELAMKVIVQEMIDPELAGVIFTINPATGKEEIVIEACEGVAEDLLSGKASSLAKDHPLMLKYQQRLENLAEEVQIAYGSPQDIEFAIRNDEIYLLQARPITRINFSPEFGEWTNADFRDGGVSSTVCTPLMWSLYDYIWEDGLNNFLASIKLNKKPFKAGEMFFGRPYWNLGEVKQCLSKIPGFVERDFDADINAQVTYEGNGIETPVNLINLLKVIPTALAVNKVFKQQQALCYRYLNGYFDELEQAFAINEEDVTDEKFHQLITHYYKQIETDYFNTIFCSSLAKLDFTDTFPKANYTTMVAGLPDIKHLAPTREIKRMVANGETDISPLLEKFKHHSRKELDLRVPRWDQDREFVQLVFDQFQQQTEQGEDPREIYQREKTQFLSTLNKKQQKTFTKKLDRLREFLWLREEMRDCSTKTYYHIRRYLMALAEKHGWGEDIFFMTLEDIYNKNIQAIEKRKRYYQAYRNFKAPNEIGSHFAFDKTSPSDSLQGIGASQGVKTAVARVVLNVEDTVRIKDGEILVCPFTDPGWTPVLNRVSAVVTETGGLLSHAAVICRESGIPAVLGIIDATRMIKDGQTITVDGSGFVTIEK